MPYKLRNGLRNSSILKTHTHPHPQERGEDLKLCLFCLFIPPNANHTHRGAQPPPTTPTGEEKVSLNPQPRPPTGEGEGGLDHGRGGASTRVTIYTLLQYSSFHFIFHYPYKAL